jgi:hypothetical protein
MLFTMNLKDISFSARVVIYVSFYLWGIFSGLHSILCSLVRMTWEITWPVMGPVVRRIWPEFEGLEVDQEWLPWCEVAYCSHWASQPGPFEMVRMSADLYVITWRGWRVDLFTSPRVDRALSYWVQHEVPEGRQNA